MAHKKSVITTQKKFSIFYSFRKKSSEWHTKTLKFRTLNLTKNKKIWLKIKRFYFCGHYDIEKDVVE